jgi:hypothetical protein
MALRVNTETGEVYLYGIVGESWGEECFVAGDVLDALNKLKGKKCIARINSPGGVADEGIAIYNALKRYPGGCDTVVDALAASAASVIALAGQSRETSEGSRWMIHKAITLAYGNSNQMLKAASTLETYDKSLIEIYSKYMPGTEDEIMNLLDAETWYTSDDAVKAGLSTSRCDATDAEPMIAAWFKNPPEALLRQTFNKGKLAKFKAQATLQMPWMKK